MTHEDPTEFLKRVKDPFFKHLKETLNDFKQKCEEGSVDIVITGGNVNYNYTPNSDIDLHIVMSRSSINPDRAFVDEHLQDKKILWTLQHPDISIYGYPVELYAQDIDEKPHANQGVYSLIQNRWIARPQMLDLNFEDDYHLQKKVQFYKNIIDKMIDDNEVDRLMDMMRDSIMSEVYRDWETDRKSTRLNSSHLKLSRMPSSA